MWPREPWHVRWGRRALTIPALLAATAIYWALMPAILVVAGVLDLARGGRFLRCRFHLTIGSVFSWHVVGVAALGLYWVIGKSLRVGQARWRRWHRRVEGWWSHKMIGICSVFYGLRFDVRGADLAKPGPTIIMARHASIVDTLLPARLLSRGPTGLLMRIVKKRELLWDPGVDLIAHRLPRAFVRRGSGDVARELEQLQRLVGGMDEDDAIVIFPEGTRFTAAKQEAIRKKLRATDPEAARRAERLRHLLPPRAAGSFALLEARPDMDVVFLAHTGLEGASKLEDFLDGSLLGRTLRAQFFRVPRHEVPTHPAAFAAWLQSWWERLDQWIDARRCRPS